MENLFLAMVHHRLLPFQMTQKNHGVFHVQRAFRMFYSMFCNCNWCNWMQHQPMNLPVHRHKFHNKRNKKRNVFCSCIFGALSRRLPHDSIVRRQMHLLSISHVTTAVCLTFCTYRDAHIHTRTQHFETKDLIDFQKSLIHTRAKRSNTKDELCISLNGFEQCVAMTSTLFSLLLLLDWLSCKQMKIFDFRVCGFLFFIEYCCRSEETKGRDG